jgi:hypothetical protein
LTTTHVLKYYFTYVYDNFFSVTRTHTHARAHAPDVFHNYHRLISRLPFLLVQNLFRK